MQSIDQETGVAEEWVSWAWGLVPSRWGGDDATESQHADPAYRNAIVDSIRDWMKKEGHKEDEDLSVKLNMYLHDNSGTEGVRYEKFTAMGELEYVVFVNCRRPVSSHRVFINI